MLHRACDQRGFALIESLATTVFASLAITGGLTLAYASFARLWLKHAAYETSICLSTKATVANCRRDFQSSTAQALPIGQIDTVHLERHASQVTTHVHWTLARGVSLAIDDSRSLPLLGPVDSGSPPRGQR